MTIVEDLSGNVARLMVSNLEDSIVDPILLKGSIIVVKQPTWNALVEGGYQIRVDHPCDLIVFEDFGSEEVPEQWREAEEESNEMDSTFWKKEGDRMFLEKKFRRALDW